MYSDFFVTFGVSLILSFSLIHFDNPMREPILLPKGSVRVIFQAHKQAIFI